MDNIIQNLQFAEDLIRHTKKTIMAERRKKEKIKEEPESSDEAGLEKFKKLLGSEKFRIEAAKKMVSTNKGVAKLLNISERSLYRKLKEYNL